MRSFLLTICVLVILPLACGDGDNPVDSSPPEDDGPVPDLGQWVTLASLPTARQEMPHVVMEGKIYVPGGIDGARRGTNIIEIYDPASDSWTTGLPLPESLHHFGFAAANGTLYVIGGYVGNSFVPSSGVFELNGQNNDWNRKPDMPIRRGAHVAVTLNEKIYVIGGADQNGRALDTNQMFDPAANSWTSLAAMPTPREHLAAAVIDSLVYVVGGRSSGAQGLTNSNRLEAYSPAQDSWQVLSNMPTARGGLAAAALNGKLYVFGGEFPAVFRENQEYAPKTNTWRRMTPLPTPRHGMGAAAMGDRIFVIGGGPVAGFGVTAVNEAFTPPAD